MKHQTKQLLALFNLRLTTTLAAAFLAVAVARAQMPAALMYDSRIGPIAFGAGDVRAALMENGYAVTVLPPGDPAKAAQSIRIILTNEDAISSIILGNSLLTARGILVAGEYEVKNAQAMKIMDTFVADGSFTEYYAKDFVDNVVLISHDGPGHIRIAEGKTKVRPLKVYHGKVGKGLSVEMSVKHGPAHHCAVGVGHIADKIDKLGKLLRMEVVRVC
jgi:hypothetical protein